MKFSRGEVVSYRLKIRSKTANIGEVNELRNSEDWRLKLNGRTSASTKMARNWRRSKGTSNQTDAGMVHRVQHT
ncbi:hypothetical protein E2C01_060575 [Portunus trituberculatus]|uniref:Uncharacterized protein n=1 Tax=Portunus trituberculatus TaxID=210409 RepID=A0A5B7HBT7_PORTR|nr:hypothetical protein [Portunus trituberculatus]